MGTIIPRWEWRTFGKEFGDAEAMIKAHQLTNFKKSSEKYILSRKSNENTKIRDDLMDIKSLKKVNGEMLEQWYPTMKESFPMKKETIEVLFRDFFKTDVPEFARDVYTYNEYLEELVAVSSDLEIVDVYKERNIYDINGAIVEIADVKFNGMPQRTICVEHADPDKVIGIVKELGLYEYPNINYLNAMKKAVGMER